MKDYPKTETQMATAERHARRRGRAEYTVSDVARIERAQAKRDRRQRKAD